MNYLLTTAVIFTSSVIGHRLHKYSLLYSIKIFKKFDRPKLLTVILNKPPKLFKQIVYPLTVYGYFTSMSLFNLKISYECFRELGFENSLMKNFFYSMFGTFNLYISLFSTKLILVTLFDYKIKLF